jgi:hypothetical protein
MRRAACIGGRRRTAVLVVAGVVLYTLSASALDPNPAAAQIGLPNPIDAVSGLLGGPADIVSGLGASVLKEALEWLLGGLQATITLELVKFMTTVELPVGGALSEAAGPIVVIGGFFLVVGLITSIGDGYREIVAGTDTAPRVIGQAIFRVVGLALLLGSWFWIVPLAVEAANGMSQYVLSDGAVGSALRRTFASHSLLDIGPLLGLLTAIFMALALLILVVLKFVIAIAFACLYVGGPALIGFAALPRVGTLPLALATRGIVTLMSIPLAWTVVFVAWAGVSAGMFDAATGSGSGVVKGLMGPGLFLAGLIVMLAVTKRLLSMASFGLPLSVAGVGIVRGIVRSALNFAGSKALLDAADRARGKAAEDASGTPAPRKGADGQPMRDHTPAPQSGSQAAQTASGAEGGGRRRPFRKLFEGGGAAMSAREEWSQRQEHRARVEEAEREEQARDANAIATAMRRGVWRSREAPRDEALAQRVDELRTVWGGPPTDRAQQAEGLQTAGDGAAAAEAARGHEQANTGGVPAGRVSEAGQVLPAGDRSGFAAAARTALENHRGDRVAAWREFRHAAISQYAGREGMSTEQREAVATLAAAPPERVWAEFRPDYERFQWRQPEIRADPPPTGGYDPELFRFARREGGGER